MGPHACRRSSGAIAPWPVGQALPSTGSGRFAFSWFTLLRLPVAGLHHGHALTRIRAWAGMPLDRSMPSFRCGLSVCHLTTLPPFPPGPPCVVVVLPGCSVGVPELESESSMPRAPERPRSGTVVRSGDEVNEARQGKARQGPSARQATHCTFAPHRRRAQGSRQLWPNAATGSQSAKQSHTVAQGCSRGAAPHRASRLCSPCPLVAL
jgi:hypothetical protein